MLRVTCGITGFDVMFNNDDDARAVFHALEKHHGWGVAKLIDVSLCGGKAVPPYLTEAADLLCQSGNLIAAIRLVRGALDVSLVEARDYIRTLPNYKGNS